MSLDGVELILRAEETFGVALPEQETCRVSTPGQLIDLVCTKLKTTGGIYWDRAQVAERIRTILIEDFSVDPRTYQEGSSLTRDLGFG